MAASQILSGPTTATAALSSAVLNPSLQDIQRFGYVTMPAAGASVVVTGISSIRSSSSVFFSLAGAPAGAIPVGGLAALPSVPDSAGLLKIQPGVGFTVSFAGADTRSNYIYLYQVVS